jgi:AcrR family transcriptional regulator
MDRSSTDRIVKAATELFSQQGYKSTSMEAVAELAGTSRSLVFFHFGSKELLLDAVVGTMIDQYREVVEAAIGKQTGLDALRAMVAARQTMIAARHDLARLVYLLIGDAIGLEPALAVRFSALDRAMSGLFAQWLRQAQEHGDLPDAMDASAMGALVLSMFHGNSVQWLLDPNAFDVGAADWAIVRLLELLEPATS